MLTELSGVVVMLAVAAIWILGFWLGWSLVLSSGASTGMTHEGREAEAVHVVAHVRHLLGTLGGAVTEPAGPGWNVLNALSGLNGMLALTLSASFLLSTRATLQSARALAVLVATGGARPVR